MMGAVAPVENLQMRADAVVHLLDEERDEVTGDLDAHGAGCLEGDKVVGDFWQALQHTHGQRALGMRLVRGERAQMDLVHRFASAPVS
jgi:hypothetical protein